MDFEAQTTALEEYAAAAGAQPFPEVDLPDFMIELSKRRMRDRRGNFARYVKALDDAVDVLNQQ